MSLNQFILISQWTLEIGDTIILEEKVREIDIKTILQLADSFHESLHVFKQQQQICKEETNSCLDTCDQVQKRLQQLNYITKVVKGCKCIENFFRLTPKE